MTTLVLLWIEYCLSWFIIKSIVIKIKDWARELCFCYIFINNYLLMHMFMVVVSLFIIGFKVTRKGHIVNILEFIDNERRHVTLCVLF